MPVVSQSIISPIVPVGASTVACELRTPCASPSSTASSHERCAAPSSSGGTSSSSIFAASARCMRSTFEHRLGVLGVAGERAHAARGARARRVGVAGHQRGDRARPRPALGRVVREALGHEQRAEVRVAEPELAELPAVLGDLLGRVVGVADEDLLRGEHDLDRVPVALDVEPPLRPPSSRRYFSRLMLARLHAELSRCMYSRARVAGVDAAGVRRRVPPVDRRVELHAGVGALPRRLGDLAHELARLHRLDGVAGGDGLEVPVVVVDHGLHEVVGDAHRVVRVLVLDRVAVAAVEVHVEAGVAQRPRLAAPRGPCTRRTPRCRGGRR